LRARAPILASGTAPVDRHTIPTNPVSEKTHGGKQAIRGMLLC